MTIMKITTEQIEFFNKNGRKTISIVNETGSIQIVGLVNIERFRAIGTVGSSMSVCIISHLSLFFK